MSPLSSAIPVSRERVRAIDWLRGLSVIVMIQCHSLVLLTPELRKSVWTGWLLKLDGLVAPAFIFSAGFALSLLMVRSAAAGMLADRAGRNLRRIAEVFAVAALVNTVWFPIRTEPVWLLRLDILHCVGLCLLLTLPLAALLASRPSVLAGAAFLLALGAFALAPFSDSAGEPWASFLRKSTWAPFPLVPWIGFAWLGACCGCVAGAWGRKGLARVLGLLIALGFVGTLMPHVLSDLYPPHRFFVTNPSNSATRFMWVCAVLLGLLWVEGRMAPDARPSRARRFLEVFGTASLSAYFFHEMLLYYRVFGVFSFERVWGDSSGWLKYSGLLALLIASTFVLCIAVDPAERALKTGLARARDLLLSARWPRPVRRRG
ncbi:heparan-alpha-glucosaminide N-acetyltransferase domain-containing protein [Corallococcus sp. Z5C101001]|uniref:heparan-alpha-glucosaminide N-acetyltransferase domain-containing protein n=1 Tax=Corallococcus sp. Z5C101001 TaxID=2596829 RepID=UPI0011814F90|nr:heparan-alpha-glucosaminide N-acetyltransferase domain-containing protein [Corallococcus sp. Z5C101001]TSC31165.1 DUF1624 domain-containing protein [Corallococcus sp. Z5C101001]